MTKVLARGITRTTGDADLHRLVTTPELLVVCDFEGTLTDLDVCGFRPIKGSLRVMSDLASLPQTRVAIISHGSVASLTTGPRGNLDHRVSVIDAGNVSLGDRDDARTPRRAPRKILSIDALLAHHSPSLIFFAGDDESDEEVFAALGVDDIGCKVGHGRTAASLQLDNPTALVKFLGCVHRRRRSLVNRDLTAPGVGTVGH